jgi:hypothetical protein
MTVYKSDKALSLEVLGATKLGAQDVASQNNQDRRH